MNQGDNNIESISREQLDAIYAYLAMEFENLTKEEKSFWLEILEKIDAEFYED